MFSSFIKNIVFDPKEKKETLIREKRKRRSFFLSFGDGNDKKKERHLSLNNIKARNLI